MRARRGQQGDNPVASDARHGESDGVDQETIEEIPIAAIRPSPFQPRIRIDEASLDGLARSIAAHGLMQPVLVRQLSEGSGYELIVGERRLRACQRLGWERIPAVVKDVPGDVAAEMTLIENLQREQLDYIEEARGYKRLLEEFGITQRELAERIGKSQSSVANKLRLLGASAEAQDFAVSHGLSERHLRAVLRLTDESDQLAVLEEAAGRGLSVRQTEALVEKALSRRKQEQRRVVRVFKDARLFVNSVRKLVRELEASGLDVQFEVDEMEDGVDIAIRLRRPERQAVNREK